MPTTPYAVAQIAVNGGAPQQGGLTVAGASTIQLSGTNTSNWTQARWEIFAYPYGWPTPTGWTLDAATGIIYSTDTTPTLITLEAASVRWGKWLVRLIVNGGSKNGVPPTSDPITGSYLPNDVIDIASGWEVVDPSLGLHEPALYEGTQFGGLRRWAGPLQSSLHTIASKVAALGSRASIDFVIDCGADPTGATDSSAAFTKAMTLLQTLSLSSTVPTYSLTLFVPPGKYLLSSNFSVPFDFNNLSTAVKIQGSGKDSSFFMLPGGVNAPSIINVYGFELRDLTWIGTATPGTPDVAAGFTVSASGPSTVHNVRFANISASSWALCLEGAEWTLSDVLFTNCSCTDATKGVLYTTSLSSVTFDGVRFIDVGSVNGFSTANKTAYSLAPWYRHDDSQTLVSGGAVHGIIFRNCWFDEGAEGQIKIVGGPTNNVHYVRVEACMFNPSTLGTLAYPLIDLTNVDVAIVEGILNSGFNNTSTCPIVNCTGVGSLVCRGIQVANTVSSRSIAADATTKCVRIIDSPNVTTASINAAVTLLIENDGVMQPAAAPPAPATGAVVYVDSADGYYKVQSATGLATLCGAHGLVRGGNAGASDLSAAVGPYPGSETSFSGLFFYAHGAAASAWSTAIYSDLSGVTIQSTGSWALKWLTGALWSMSGSMRVGSNVAGATTTLVAGADTAYVTLGGNGVALTSSSPTIATTGNTTLTAAQYACGVIRLGTISLTGNITITFPNAAGGPWYVDCSGVTLNGHTIQFVSGTTTSAAFTPSTTNGFAIVMTFGANAITFK